MRPEPDLESARWWAGLRDHRIVLQRCGSCRTVRFPPLPACPACGSRDVEEIDARGAGTIYSYVTAHQHVSPGYDGPLPYTVATVTLEEGVRVLAQVEPAEAAAIGAAVTPAFVDHGEWTELRFAVGGP